MWYIIGTRYTIDNKLHVYDIVPRVTRRTRGQEVLDGDTCPRADHNVSPSTMSLLFSSLSFSEALSPPITGRSR